MSTNETLGKMLKYYRRLNNLKVRDVKARLEDYDIYISEKTIYGWESNQNPPSADKFLILCEIYKIPDINFTFLQKKSGREVKLSKDERVMLQHYRMRPQMQDAVRKILEMPDPAK